MRLKPEKIEELAGLVHEALAANPELKLQESREKIVHLIRLAIQEDLMAEDAIEEEARRLLGEHMDEIQRKGMSFDMMLLKAKQRIAQERKMVL
jgi:hypothetical protein